MAILFIPCCSIVPLAKFKETVETPVRFASMKEDVGSRAYGMMESWGSERYCAWGMTLSEGNAEVFGKLRPGDKAVFYRDDLDEPTLFCRGEVVAKELNSSYGKKLWRSYSGEGAFVYLFYLTDVYLIDSKISPNEMGFRGRDSFEDPKLYDADSHDLGNYRYLSDKMSVSGRKVC